MGMKLEVEDMGEHSILDYRLIRLNIQGRSEVEGIMNNPKKTDWDSYARYFNNKIIHPSMSRGIRSELELEAMVKNLRRGIGILNISQKQHQWQYSPEIYTRALEKAQVILKTNKRTLFTLNLTTDSISCFDK